MSRDLIIFGEYIAFSARKKGKLISECRMLHYWPIFGTLAHLILLRRVQDR